MASTTGGQYVFSGGAPVNLQLTPDGSGLPATVAGSLNIEIFTAANGSTDPNYQGSAFALNGTQGPPGTINAQNLQLNDGVYQVTDLGNTDVITGGTGSGVQTIVGGANDTIIGRTQSLVIDATQAINQLV